MASSRSYDLSFFTATILEWKPLLASDVCKDTIIESLKFLVNENRIQLNALVIMNNHFHLIWHIFSPYTLEQVQRSFLRYTAQMLIKDMRNNDRVLLHEYRVDISDRKHQIWKRNSLSIGIWTEEVLRQKLKYIHNNPVKAGYCQFPEEEEYKYSTAALYNGLPSDWDFVTPCYF